MIWTYWEGPKSAWIELCHETLLKVHPRARVLGWEDFDNLWRSDRDIPLDHLRWRCQRADFVRTYLLLHYGGLWLDADCVVLQRMDWVREGLSHCDFIGYTMRKGRIWINDLMASNPQGKVISRYYERMKELLRQRRPLGRNRIGPRLLTEVCREESEHVLRLPKQSVHPIGYGPVNVRRYITERPDAEHAEIFEDGALCYLLTNGALGYLRRASRDEILASRTFAGYLFRRALEQ